MLKEKACSFRAAYNSAAKERWTYTNLSPIMKLNEMNGVTVNPAPQSDHSCAQIAEHITQGMKRTYILFNVKSLDSLEMKTQFIDDHR